MDARIEQLKQAIAIADGRQFPQGHLQGFVSRLGEWESLDELGVDGYNEPLSPMLKAIATQCPWLVQAMIDLNVEINPEVPQLGEAEGEETPTTAFFPLVRAVESFVNAWDGGGEEHEALERWAEIIEILVRNGALADETDPVRLLSAWDEWFENLASGAQGSSLESLAVGVRVGQALAGGMGEGWQADFESAMLDGTDSEASPPSPGRSCAQEVLATPMVGPMWVASEREKRLTKAWEEEAPAKSRTPRM